MPEAYSELAHNSPDSLAAAQATNAASDRPAQRMRVLCALLVLSALLTAALVVNERFSAPLHLRGLQPLPWRLERPAPLPKLPWAPLLTEQERARGIAHYGSGARMRRVAAKLLRGQPIKAFTLGGSVTFGHGVQDAQLQSFPARLFQFVEANFPNRHHVLSNQGLPGSTAPVIAPCTPFMIAPDPDLVVIELSTNESPASYQSSSRHAYEGLIRWLLDLPSQPAVVLLHHYAWWKASGDGMTEGLFYREPEGQLSMYSQYYDLPSVSLRAAAWRNMRDGVDGFRVDRVITRGNRNAVTGQEIPGAEPGTEANYLYYDTIHPGPSGHQVLAELLAGLITKAAQEVAAGATSAPAPRPGQEGLPPPMVKNFRESRTSVCAQLRDFEPAVVQQDGFDYGAEKPDLPSWVEQKWGWRSREPGAWAEVEVDTRWLGPMCTPARSGSSSSSSSSKAASTADSSGGNATANINSSSIAAARSPAPSPAPSFCPSRTEVHISHLRSYSGMGTARIECVAGCSCQPSVLDGTTASRVSVFKTTSFEVSHHKRCRFRVTVTNEAGEVPQEGHKVVLAAVMVTHKA